MAGVHVVTESAATTSMQKIMGFRKHFVLSVSSGQFFRDGENDKGAGLGTATSPLGRGILDIV
eukprot:12398805-Karenia_brevis.AAC.2